MERPTINQTYEAFELLVSNRATDGYLATVVESPAGEGETFCILNVDDDLRNVLRAVEQDLIDETYLAELGSFFFNALFTGDVATLYRTSLGMARSQHKRLRVRLRITPPELAALPWEYLYDLQEDAFLAIAPETALVRYVPISLPVRPTTVSSPLRVLAVIASPQGVQPLDVEREIALLHEALAEWVRQTRVQIEIVKRAIASEISQAMRRFQPHVFHFVGHGLFEKDVAHVVLENEQGDASLVDERTFREFFTGCQETRLAVLNACQTATVSSSQPLVGLAPRLLQRQLSAVVAMQHPIPDHAALIFTREFYRSLAIGFPVDAAISEARKGIFLELGAGSPAWGSPVLFLRAKDSLLFSVATAEAKPLDIPPPPNPTQPPEILGFVGRDAELRFFAEKLKTTHLAVIAGMAGVGKTALVVKLTEWVAHDRDHIFWHSFHEGEGIDAIVWSLAGFLAWHKRSDLWNMLQASTQIGGRLPPPEILFDYLLQLIRNQGYLLCLDDFHYIDEDPLLAKLVERLMPVVAAGEVQIVLTSRRIPDFVRIAEHPPLSGLSIADAKELLVACDLSLSDEMFKVLYQRTNGNAELLTLVIHALNQNNDPASILEHLVHVDDIERYLLNEVDKGLQDTERQVMHGVSALLGYPGTRLVIEEVLGGVNSRRQLVYLTNRYLLQQYVGKSAIEYVQHPIIQAFY